MESRQQSIQSRCVHPSGSFIPFRVEEIEQSIPARFEEQVARDPERLAVRSRGQQLTYEELNRAANRVARAILVGWGEAEEPVALLFEHDAPAIAAIFGVLKAGKIYLPLDPTYPLQRLAYLVEDSGARLVVTNRRNLWLARSIAGAAVPCLDVDALETGLSAANPGLSIRPDRFASLYYTSGSTGQPKGVVENHRNRLVNAMRNTNALRICAEDRLLLLYHSNFSGAVNTTFGALLNGATLVPFDLKSEGMNDLAQWITDERVTIYHSPPTVFRSFIDALTGSEAFEHLRVVMLASDSVYSSDVALFRNHFPDTCFLLNAWGATESPFFRPYFLDHQLEISGSSVPAIGVSTEEEEILLLDEAGKEVGPSQAGEIALKSRYLSPGYWRRPELTRERFHPEGDGGDRRIYFTGDLGRRLPDGSMVHLGRKDFQVKVRGYRIELAEIETALLGTGLVREAVVAGLKTDRGDQRLVGYVVPKGEAVPTVSDLRRALAGTLPGYMIPAALVVLNELPRTPNGKVDRAQLPVPGRSRPVLSHGYRAPRHRTEGRLARIWAELLELEEVGIHDPFLELGGDSLLATQVISRVQQQFGVNLTVRDLLATATVADMAHRILAHQVKQTGPEESERLVTELEAMSSDQVRGLLADEAPGDGGEQ
jgi:amino acid adenylation domain-containing protein